MDDVNGNTWKVDVCRSYDDDVEKDATWKAAQAFSIMAPIWGVLAFVPMMVSPNTTKITGLLLLVACLFQGLTLLILKSELCDAYENPLFGQFPVLQATGVLTTEDKCTLGRSAIVSICATCLWFLAGLFAVALPVDE